MRDALACVWCQGAAIRPTVIAASAAVGFAALIAAVEYGIFRFVVAEATSVEGLRASQLAVSVTRVGVVTVAVFLTVGIWLRRAAGRNRVASATRWRVAVEQRQAAAASLAASVAHDLRNFLGVASGNLELCLTHRELPNGLRAHLEAARHGVEQACELSSRLGRFGRKGHGARRASIPVVALLNECAELARHHERMARVRDFRVRADAAPTIEGEPTTLATVILNLLLNAGDAAGHGGVVELHCYGEGDGCVRIEVHDDGPGIPEADRERVFEPFFTSKPHGTGLGLPSARRAIEGMGGSMLVSTSPLGGACLTLRIPASCPERPRP